MKLRWFLATGAALSLALLTIPAVGWFAFNAGPNMETESVKAEPAELAVCDQDAQPANLDFTLKDMNGEDVSLLSHEGKVILLNFWATWCGPCKIEIPGFVELQDEYRDQGLVVLGVSIDDPVSKIKPFAEEYKVNYPMLVGLGRGGFSGSLWANLGPPNERLHLARRAGVQESSGLCHEGTVRGGHQRALVRLPPAGLTWVSLLTSRSAS